MGTTDVHGDVDVKVKNPAGDQLIIVLNMLLVR